jgi:hypothetical protein
MSIFQSIIDYSKSEEFADVFVDFFIPVMIFTIPFLIISVIVEMFDYFMDRKKK